MKVVKIPVGSDFSHTMVIREKVFCNEQGYSLESEFDEFDSSAYHIVIYDNTLPVATGRVLKENDGVYKVGRIAVLEEYRGQKLGKLLVENLIDYAAELGADTIKVGAQTRVKGFYETLGFKVCGDEYMDEHIPHAPMIKHL